MTTIEDKIKLFANVIYEKVEKQSHQKLEQAIKNIDEDYSAEKIRLERTAKQIIDERIKKSEARATQIISKARIDAKQSLLNKKEELLTNTINGLKALAEGFVQAADYDVFLQRAIAKVLSGFENGGQLILYFTKGDLMNKSDLIHSAVKGAMGEGADYSLKEADRNIIGGCICENMQRTRRADYTMISLLEDNKELIGQTVMERLQVTGGGANVN